MPLTSYPTNRVRDQGVTWSITLRHYFTTLQWDVDACRCWCGILRLTAFVTPPACNLRPHDSKSFRPVLPPRPAFRNPRNSWLPTKHSPVCGNVMRSLLAGVAWGSIHSEVKAHPQQRLPVKVFNYNRLLICKTNRGGYISMHKPALRASPYFHVLVLI
jgi:hypothetical protein